MTRTIEATYVNGVLKPHKPLDLEEGSDVRVTIEPVEDEVDDPLAAVIGICDDGPPISLAERHDEFAYGLPPGKGPS
jgi:predicted DNA-binding antitoxin AbrB/MazE fold protein